DKETDSVGKDATYRPCWTQRVVCSRRGHSEPHFPEWQHRSLLVHCYFFLTKQSVGRTKKCATSKSLGFYRRHSCIELGIVRLTISAGMNASVTVWTECNHMCRMIWAAIA